MKFYEKEIQKSNQTLFRIKIVIKRKEDMSIGMGNDNTGQQNFMTKMLLGNVSGLIFQADFETENHFSLSGLVLLT